MSREADIKFIGEVYRWPLKPFLPLRRRPEPTPNNPNPHAENATLYFDDRTSQYLLVRKNIFVPDQVEDALRAGECEVYKNPRDIIEQGWYVD